MNTNAKPLNISESQAQKALDEAIGKIVNKKANVALLPTDWTLERLMEKGISETQARDTLNKMIKDGLAVEIRYRKPNGYYSKGCRAK
jgi:DNA replicative helicase MCM subunit Mcm2 (Cdc46/Mcm family)